MTRIPRPLLAHLRVLLPALFLAISACDGDALSGVTHLDGVPPAGTKITVIEGCRTKTGISTGAGEGPFDLVVTLN